MGVTHSTYLGPYIRCQNGRIEGKEHHKACKNKDCKLYKDASSESDNFCRACGSKVGTISKKSYSYIVDVGEVDEAIGVDVLYQPGACYSEYPFEEDVDYFISNTKVKGVKQRGGDSYESGAWEITPEVIEKEKSSFELGLKNPLKILRDYYGADGVSVHWGMLMYDG